MHKELMAQKMIDALPSKSLKLRIIVFETVELESFVIVAHIVFFKESIKL